jgi:hypothetical protein
VAFAPADLETAELLSRMVGPTTMRLLAAPDFAVLLLAGSESDGHLGPKSI